MRYRKPAYGKMKKNPSEAELLKEQIRWMWRDDRQGRTLNTKGYVRDGVVVWMDRGVGSVYKPRTFASDGAAEAALQAYGLVQDPDGGWRVPRRRGAFKMNPRGDIRLTQERVELDRYPEAPIFVDIRPQGRTWYRGEDPNTHWMGHTTWMDESDIPKAKDARRRIQYFVDGFTKDQLRTALDKLGARYYGNDNTEALRDRLEAALYKRIIPYEKAKDNPRRRRNPALVWKRGGGGTGSLQAEVEGNSAYLIGPAASFGGWLKGYYNVSFWKGYTGSGVRDVAKSVKGLQAAKAAAQADYDARSGT